MSGDIAFKRRKFFNYSIKRKLQFRMLLKIWAIVLASLLLAGIIFYFYSDITVGKSYRLFHVKADNFLDFLFPVLIAGFFASLILGVIAALFFPHAIAGPIYRIEQKFDDIGKGNLNKEINFRKGDKANDLAGSLNTMIGELRNKIEAISDSSGKIGELIEGAGGKDPDETLKKIKKAHANLQATIEKFKL